jgi:hypothetical protein
MAKADLMFDQLPELSWDQRHANESLDNLFAYVAKKAEDAINWYYAGRKRKRLIGSALRYGVILSTAAAGIIPILGTIYKHNNIPAIEPAWSAIAIAIAALMIAFDKFGDFTSGWVRYILAAQELNQALENFRFTWEIEKLKLSTPAKTEETQAMIAKCKEFLLQVQAIVDKETQKWVAEFQSAIKEIDEAAKIAAEVAKEKAKMEQVGAISIEVTNGNDCGDGWYVSLDGGPEKQFKGKRGALTGIKPGIIAVKAVGQIKGKECRDNKPVEVSGGKTSNLTLKLE